MGKYFEKFPTISYNGTPAKNILLRTRISQQTFNTKDAFVDYELKDHLTRPDNIANNYYEDPYYDWLYYMSNEIVNPYADRYLSQEELTGHIKKKYGSVEYTRSYVIGYRNNWASDDTELSTDQYSRLSIAQQKYYDIVIDYFGSVIGYKRKRVDWVLDNNKIQILKVADTNKMTFLAVGEYYKQVDASGQTVATGLLRGFDIENKTLTFTRITGDFQADNTYRLFGIYRYKNWKYRVVSVINPYVVNGTQTNPIPEEESQFWEPVYLYDRILENNEEKKKIKLLRNSLKGRIEQEMKKLLRF